MRAATRSSTVRPESRNGTQPIELDVEVLEEVIAPGGIPNHNKTLLGED